MLQHGGADNANGHAHEHAADNANVVNGEDRRAGETAPFRYRLVLEGELAPEWADWFGAERVEHAGGRTVLELVVSDQAALHGALRRAHDLHLPLVSLTRLDVTR